MLWCFLWWQMWITLWKLYKILLLNCMYIHKKLKRHLTVQESRSRFQTFKTSKVKVRGHLRCCHHTHTISISQRNLSTHPKVRILLIKWQFKWSQDSELDQKTSQPIKSCIGMSCRPFRIIFILPKNLQSQNGQCFLRTSHQFSDIHYFGLSLFGGCHALPNLRLRLCSLTH